jgi:hypothetical protein
VCERSTLQLPLQSGDLGTAEFRPAGRPLRGDTSRPTLTPLPPPPFHRSFRHSQSGGDGLVPVTGFEPSHSIQPHSLPGFPLGVGQAAALRVPHGHSTTAQRAQGSAERPDITQLSSVVLLQGIELAHQAADIIFRTAGSSAARKDSMLGRYWRNICVMRGHVAHQVDSAAINFGRTHFGLPPVGIA